MAHQGTSEHKLLNTSSVNNEGAKESQVYGAKLLQSNATVPTESSNQHSLVKSATLSGSAPKDKHNSTISIFRRTEKKQSLRPFSWEQFYAIDDTYTKQGAQDISHSKIEQVSLLLPLQFWNFDIIPHRMRASKKKNNTVTIYGMWCEQNIPSITGGPLLGKYNFCQLHFHCGQNRDEEHSVNRMFMPLELHAVFMKEDYEALEIAECQQDGIVILVYFCMCQPHANRRVELIMDYLDDLREYPLAELFCFPLGYLLNTFSDNYFSYWGSLHSPHGSKTAKPVWIICRNSIGLASDQVTHFQSLMGTENIDEFRSLDSGEEEDEQDTIFLIDPSGTEPLIHPPKIYY